MNDEVFLRKHGVTPVAALSVGFTPVTPPSPSGNKNLDDLLREYGAASVLFISSNQSVQDIRSGIESGLRGSRIVCGDGYQRESVRAIVSAALPCHYACRSFWWYAKN
jgi:hypothetical protein